MLHIPKGYLFFYSLYLLFVGFVSIFIPRWGANYLMLEYVDTVMTRSYGICFLMLGLVSLLAAIDLRRYFLNFVIVTIGSAFFVLQYGFEWLIGTAGLLQLGIPFLTSACYLYCAYKILFAQKSIL